MFMGRLGEIVRVPSLLVSNAVTVSPAFPLSHVYLLLFTQNFSKSACKEPVNQFAAY